MPLLPAAVVLLFSLWAGTYYSGASAAGAATAQLTLLAVVAAWGLRGDPLGLGRGGRWLVAALLVSAAASWLASPVPRAGRVGMLLLPAFLMLPGCVARCWAGPERQRRGLTALAAALALIAGWALGDHLLLGSPRAAAPLGHHNLLVPVLLALLPPAALAWRWPGLPRGTAATAVVLGTGALLATRSLLALLGLAVLGALAAVAAGHRHRGRRLARVGLLGVVLLAAVAAMPRLARVVSGHDPSALARWTYWQAAWEGACPRPLLGWGPGSTPWTVARWLEPRPGIQPPGEAVGQVHSLPLQLAYELGFPATFLVAAVGGVFVLRRCRPAGASPSTAMARAGVIGLGAASTALLGTAPLAIPAVPLALAVAAGAALTGDSRTAAASNRPGRLLGVAYALGAAACLLPSLLGQGSWDVAREREGEAAARAVATAALRDPTFPLYRGWEAWTGGTGAGPSGPVSPASASRDSLAAARAAAEGAPGVAPLWLMAGVLGSDAGAPWADAALLHACRMDPLGALPAFYRAMTDPEHPRAAQWAARALLAEPRLAAAVFWEDREELYRASLGVLRQWPGLAPGWRQAAGDQLGAIGQEDRFGPVARLAGALDGDPTTALSLHLFRRLPRRAHLAPVELHTAVAAVVDLPAASRLPATSPQALSRQSCDGLP